MLADRLVLRYRHLRLGKTLFAIAIETYIYSINFDKISEILERDGKIFVFLGKGIHKIKRKAEQTACEETLKIIE